LAFRRPSWWRSPANGQEADRSRSKKAGFAAHLVKPLEASELVEVIEQRAVRERPTS